jgi:site-specific recombinase XerD
LEIHLPAFSLFLQSKDYSAATLPRKTQLTRHFSRWLAMRAIKVCDLDERTINDFFEDHPSTVHIRPGDFSTLCSLLAWLRQVEIIRPFMQAEEHNTCCIENDFALYLKDNRGLSQVTVRNYLPVIRLFLGECSISDTTGFYGIQVSDITRFIVNRTRTESRKTVKGRVTALRSFFRFLLYRGDITTDLAASVPAVADWRQSQIPKHLAHEDVELLLANCNRTSAIGKRDFAVLNLLARLGLRAGEVVSMTLDDFDWETGVVTIRGKGGRRDQLPIPQYVGEAIVAYLRFGRPSCKTRNVFVRFKAPFQGFSGHAAIGDIVRRALARAGLNPARKGAHLLRHSLATNMLRQGASLAEIGEILRHSSVTTTEIYIKVDLIALGALALPWPGGDA